MGRSKGARDGRDTDGRGDRHPTQTDGGDIDGDGEATPTHPPPALLLIWPGRLARASLAIFHVAVAATCVAAVAYTWLGIGGVDYAAPPLVRNAAEERAFKVGRERDAGHTAVRGMVGLWNTFGEHHRLPVWSL